MQANAETFSGIGFASEPIFSCVIELIGVGFMSVFRLGFLINPLAGSGGALANKGSDNLLLADAIAAQKNLHALARAAVFLQCMAPLKEHIHIITADGIMGGEAVNAADFSFELIKYRPPAHTARQDTLLATQEIIARGVDILVFVGGDGTARDVCGLVSTECPQQLVLGVPAGVKMQSAVYAINPTAAAELLHLLVKGELLNVHMAEVRDIDESALREGKVKSRHYGQLLVPFDGRFVQQVKQGGLVDDALVLVDIAEYLKSLITENVLCVFAPGSTLSRVQDHLGLPATLLGFDVVLAGQMLGLDVTADQLEVLIGQHAGPVRIFITVIGGQGHIIGRGNQQLRPALLRQLGKAAIQVIAPQSKLASLHGRCLFMDSGDAALDAQWAGYISVLCGYNDSVLYPLGVSPQTTSV